MKHTTLTTLVLATAALSLAGCAEPKSPSLVTLPEGYQVVAEGRPPIGFLLEEKGQVIVTDTSAHTTVYSMDFPGDGASSVLKVEDDKLIALMPDNGSSAAMQSVTLLNGLDTQHSYRIVFRRATLPPAVRSVIVLPTTMPATEPTTTITR